MSDDDLHAASSASHTGPEDATLPEGAVDDGFEPPSGTPVGRYTVLATVGRGATGVVVSAFDPQLDRKVALKFLHRAIADDDDHDRIRREAQALARLTHPNVIRVHDVGAYEGRVFMATELVDGSDLATWRDRRRPGWREVVRTMLAVGDGLAAAHAAGLVHRDFKPRNVLMGADGRPRVTDFGQARGYDEAPSSWVPRASDDSLDEPSMDGSLTRSGGLAGTPAYMAPEQLDGAPPDPLADQWSFCVSLYELLWGHRPFRGSTLPRLAASIRAGDIASVPARPRVPRGLRRVLRRGLSVDPQRRFPSMSALLRELRRATYWRHRVIWAVLPAAGAAAVTVAVWPTPPAAADYCERQERRLDAAWGPSRQAAIERTFAASERAYAATSWRRVRERIDAFAQGWSRAQRDACESQARGETVDGRMICLHRRFEELEGLLELLEHADADLVEHAVEAAQALPDLPTCDDDGPPPPADPQARRQLEEINTLLARAHVASNAGHRERALELAREAASRSESLGLRWPQAEARLTQAVAVDDDGSPEAAIDAFQAAFSAGLAAGHDRVIAHAAMGLAGLVGRTGEFDEADRWMSLAEAATQRRGDRAGPLPALLENTRGRLEYHRGRFEPALEHFRRGLALDEAAGRGDDPRQGSLHLNIGLALSSLGHYDDALASLEEAMARERYHYGDDHPRVARVLNSLCHVRSYAGQNDAGIEACEQGLVITRDNGGPRSPKLVHLYTNYGSVLFRAGRYLETADAYHDALSLATEIYGEADPMVGNVLNNLGVLHTETGELEKAQQSYQRALVVFDTAFGPEHPSTGILRTNLAMVYAHDGKLDEAEALLRRSIEVLESTLGPEHVDLALSLAELGRLHAQRGQHDQAVPLLERARALREAAGGEPVELADTKYALGLSLWERGQGARARALVGEARALYEQAGGERLVRVDELDAWLASHGG